MAPHIRSIPTLAFKLLLAKFSLDTNMLRGSTMEVRDLQMTRVSDVAVEERVLLLRIWSLVRGRLRARPILNGAAGRLLIP